LRLALAIVLFVGLAVTSAGAFPTTPVLDTCVRANENPMANGTWTGPVIIGDDQVQILSNECASQTVSVLNASSYWSASAFGPNSEAYATINTLPTLDKGFELLARFTGAGTANASGYAAGTFASGGVYNQYYYARWDNGVETALSGGTMSTLSASDKIGLEVIGSRLIIYIKIGAGAWTAVDAGVTDTTYTGAGNIGLLINATSATSVRLVNFGGGTSGAPFRTLMGVGQ
jgi:hypothetical protein